MEGQDVRYAELAKEIEEIILPICKCRQENKDVPLKDFNEKYLGRDLNKKRLDIITSIFEYLIKSPQWASNFKSDILMISFDYCLKSYEPIGKTFLNSFIYIYSRRSKEKYNPELLIIDKPVANKDDYAGSSVSFMDKIRSNEYVEGEPDGILYDVYEYASNRLEKDELNYFRYYITSHMLLLYSDEKKFVSKDYKFFGADLAILFYERVTDKNIFPFIDLDFFYEQLEMTTSYLLDFQKEKEMSGKNMQEKAYLKEKYRMAIAKKMGMKSTRMRIKENKRSEFRIEAIERFHLNI